MVVHEGVHGVEDALLFLGEVLVHLLVELGAEGVDDELGVGDLLAVQLDEGQEAALGAELAAVLDILGKKSKEVENGCAFVFPVLRDSA